jgi:hypothetical protein
MKPGRSLNAIFLDSKLQSAANVDAATCTMQPMGNDIKRAIGRNYAVRSAYFGILS